MVFKTKLFLFLTLKGYIEDALELGKLTHEYKPQHASSINFIVLF